MSADHCEAPIAVDSGMPWPSETFFDSRLTLLALSVP